jgi:hypothetical protein
MNRFIAISSRQHGELHVHALMLFTADHRANNYVFSGLSRGRHLKILCTGLEQQIPSFYLGPIPGTQQRETVYGAVAVP